MLRASMLSLLVTTTRVASGTWEATRTFGRLRTRLPAHGSATWVAGIREWAVGPAIIRSGTLAAVLRTDACGRRQGRLDSLLFGYFRYRK